MGNGTRRYVAVGVVGALMATFGAASGAPAVAAAPRQAPALSSSVPPAAPGQREAMGHVLFGTSAPSGGKRPSSPQGVAPLVVTTLPAQSSEGPEEEPGRAWLPSTPPDWPLVVGETSSPPAEVTAGVTHTETKFRTVVGPQRANVLNVDLSDPNVRFGVVLAHNKIESGNNADEVVSSMADRTGAVAGTNGDYFFGDGRFPAPLGEGQPAHLLVESGSVVNGFSLPQADSACATLSVGPGPTAQIGDETYAATVTAGTTSYPVAGVNTPVDTRGYPLNESFCGQDGPETPPLGLVELTPAIGQAAPLAAPAPVALLHVIGSRRGAYRVVSVSSVTTRAPLPTRGEVALLGEGDAAGFVSSLQPGEGISIAEHFAPVVNPDLVVGGGELLVSAGKPAYGATPDSPVHALTAVGVTRSGHRLIMAVFDGIQPQIGLGLTHAEMAGYMIAHGAYEALLFDSGGSSEMVVRQPGATRVSVVNSPSDGSQRPVAECLCVYSTQPRPGPAATVVVNGGHELNLLAGTSVPVTDYALDALGNPAAQAPRLSVRPRGLASVSGHMVEAFLVPGGGRHGRAGRLEVSAGRARSSVRLRVVGSLSSLRLSPSEPDLTNGASQTFSLAATAVGSVRVDLPLAAATWSVSPPSLGTVSREGVFTAASSGAGLATVTARAGGATATASVAVGSVAKVVDPMTDVSNWTLNTTEGATGSLSLSSSAPPGASGSMEVSYDIPAGSGVKQVAFSPDGTEDIAPVGGEDPTAVGIWVKGGSPPSASPLAPGALTLAEGYLEAGGQSVVLYPTSVDFDGWTLVVGKLSSGLDYPLTVNFLDLLVINPSTSLVGHVDLSDLEGLYSPRPTPPFHYVAIPHNPSWLRFTEDPAHFRPGGATFASFGDAHVQASDPDGTGPVVVSDIGAQLRALPPNEKPQVVQTQGDMTNNGTLADLDFLKTLLDGLGIPYHEAVGNHEIGQGTYPENGNFASVFGATHYAYNLGAARIIVLDSSHIGVEASDPYQVPAAQTHQYAWLVGQLDRTTAKVVFVVTNVPAYDPQPSGDSQFTNRYEAQMYELLAEKYQASHPRTHLVLLFGHARGFAETVINDQGQPAVGGIPNFLVADAGAPAYAPADQGGFYNYVLFHILPDGTVQFAVQPVLASITVTVPSDTLTVGHRETATDRAEGLEAEGTTPTGNNLPPLQVPIANPASHFWTTSRPRVAVVNRVTGVVTARRPGTVRISVTCDGITASTTLTVKGGPRR